MSATIRIETDAQLARLQRSCREHLPGTEIEVVGELSQRLSKGFNAYHKYRSAQWAAGGTTAAAIGGLWFGPVGWLVSAGSTVAMLVAARRKDEAEKAFRAVPLAEVAETLARAGFAVVWNDGRAITLRRS